MDANDKISQNIRDRLSGDAAIGPFEVQTQVEYSHFSPEGKPTAGLTFVVRNPLIESDPAAVEKHILARLAAIEPLAAHVEFESPQDHLKRMAGQLGEFIRMEGDYNQQFTGERTISIPPNYAQWFEELSKRPEYQTKHALRISKDAIGAVNVTISVPKDVDPAVITKNIEGRMDAIKDMLANRVLKYTEGLDTDEKKDALRAQVKALNVVVSSSGGNEWGKDVTIQILSGEQLAATKQTGVLPTEQMAALAASNPLSALKDGSGEDKGPDAPPPHLKKALARAFLTAGEGANEIFPLIAGREDMRRAVVKSLVSLKNKLKDQPEAGQKIDAFLADDVFKNPDQWNKPPGEREDFKSAPRFIKASGDPDKPYEKGVMRISLDLPADKFPALRAQLEGLDGPGPNVTAVPAAAAMPGNALEAAGKALTAAADRLLGWVQRVEAQKPPENAAPAPSMTLNVGVQAAAASDAALADAVIAGTTSAAGSWAKREEQRPTDPSLTQAI